MSRFRNTRERLFIAQKRRCYYCARKLALPKPVKYFTMQPYHATLDHIIPQAMGGSRGPTLNCVVACHQCNQERGTKDARVFLLEKMGVLT